MEEINMTMGISASINQPADFGGQIVDSEMFEITGKQNSSSNDVENPVILSGSEESESEAATTSVADQLLQSVKDEGFEEALTHLANGDFEEIPEDAGLIEDELDKENVVEDDKLEEPEAKVLEVENNEELNPEEVERQTLVSRNEELEGQVIDFQQKIRELTETSRDLREEQNALKQEFLAFVIAAYEIAKEEEDEEIKKSIMELVIDALANLMITIFVPEEPEVRKKASQTAQKEQSKKKGAKKRSLEEILRTLRDRGEIRSQPQMDTATPEPQSTEMPMAA